MKKHLLIIGTIDSLDYTIDKIINLGIEYTLFQKSTLITEKQIKTAKRIIIIDYTNLNETLALAKTIHTIDKFDAVISFTEYGLYPAALCAKSLKVLSNTIFPVELTRNKLKMRELLSTNNLSTIRFKHCETINDAENFYHDIGKKPFIIKPAESVGSRGVTLIEEISDIPKALIYSKESASCPIIAEEFIEGNEYSVESVSIRGKHTIIAITEKLTTGKPNFIEVGHNSPAFLSSSTYESVHTLIIKFLDTIKQYNGPAHTEIKINNDVPKIIESQTRIGGDQIWEMTTIVSGVDATVETICNLCNTPPPLQIKHHNAAAIRFFTLENQEILDIQGIEEATQIPNIIRIVCTLKSGQKLGSLLSSASRQGYILAAGNTLEQAIKTIEHAINTIKITTIPS